MSFGVTSTGFNPKLISDILNDIETREKTAFGATINTGGEGVLGQLNATFAAAVAEQWEVLNAVYRSFYPDSATGEALDNVAAITGATRLPATKSTATITCTGTVGTFLSTGRVISRDSTGSRWVSTEDATIGGGGTVDVAFESEEFGPIVLTSGSSLTIETPVAGWSSASISTDATLGRDLETDAEFRLRREQLLRAQGAATIEAIKADLLLVDGVLQVFVYENVSLVTDGRSLPPKSIECIVNGGTDEDVAEAIFLTKAAGIETYGHPPNDETETVTDSMGIDHTIKFTRADPVPIYIELEVDVNAAAYPSDGDAQIKEALAALGGTLGLGETVVYERFQAEVFAISGVVDCPVFKIDDTDPPTGTSNITIDNREIATFDTGDIDVTSTPI